MRKGVAARLKQAAARARPTRSATISTNSLCTIQVRRGKWSLRACVEGELPGPCQGVARSKACRDPSKPSPGDRAKPNKVSCCPVMGSSLRTAGLFMVYEASAAASTAGTAARAVQPRAVGRSARTARVNSGQEL